MTILEAIAQALGIKASSFVAGFIGGVISLRWVPDMKTWQQRLTYAIAGACAAVYVSPLVVAYFGILDGAAGIYFAVGLFGMSLGAAIMRAISGADVWALISARFGGGK